MTTLLPFVPGDGLIGGAEIRADDRAAVPIHQAARSRWRAPSQSEWSQGPGSNRLLAVPEARMADETLTSCLATLSAVFILGGDITPAQNREHLGGLGWRSLEGLEKDKTGPMPSYERVRAGSCPPHYQDRT